MDFKRITLIGIKEFRDNITSFRFLALLVVMLVLAEIDVFGDIGSYLKTLESLSSPGGYSLFGLPLAQNIFGGISSGIAGSSIFGSVIAIVLGFDLITKERETGSMKAILSVPVYRDEVINGKALGGIASIVFAVTVVFVLTFGILFVYSIVPDFSQMEFIFVFWLVTVLYLSGVFVMSLMVSSFSKTSGMSFIYSLLLFLLLTNVVYSAGIYTVDSVLGPKPSVNTNALDSSELNDYNSQVKAYYQNEMELTNLVYYISYDTNYRKISSALTDPVRYVWTQSFEKSDSDYQPDFSDIIEKVWGNILFLIAYPVVFFGIAYVKFMRLDLR
ncbi:ABC-2 type transport system permease protein [Methanomicrobium sp. W14]|uniref:ABC transporter permease subunit n=1 Tax=Methanomicrobium sp. W14 TaxID=2817839 RepID=UPI001AE6A539|nr:ABC transporter permease subunit [Methanomicrobium sp. W14]MBP2132829.1 ABC-2 type transport system permease protein [Methanomicrobium sp. W14]